MRVAYRTALLLILCTLLQGSASGQALYRLDQMFHRSWTAPDGVPPEPFQEVQDNQGILWISAASGLWRFDGTHFVQFQSPPGEPPIRQYFYFLLKTRSGICGASLLSGVICIDGGHVTSYGTSEGLPSLPARSLAPGSDGSLWVVSGGNLYHLLKGRWRRPEGDWAKNTSGIFFTQDGTQWVFGSKATLYRRNEQDPFKAADLPVPKGKILTSFSQGPSSEICLTYTDKADSSTLLRISPPFAGSIRSMSFHFPYTVWGCEFDRAGDIWVSGSGISRVSFHSKGVGAAADVVATTEHLGAEAGFSSLETHEVTEDNNGDFWVLTQRGLDLLRTPSLVRASPDGPQAATRPALATGRTGQVWVGLAKQSLQQRRGEDVKKFGKAFAQYYALVADQENSLWFHDGSRLFHMEGNRATAVPLPPGRQVMNILQIVPLPDHSELIRYSNETWRLSAGKWAPFAPDPLVGTAPTYLAVDARGGLWRAYSTGLVSSPQGLFRPDPSVRAGSIRFIVQTSEGPLATDQLHVYALQSGHLNPLRFASDTPATGISGICEDAHGDVWLNGSQGVLHISQKAFHAAMSSPRTSQLEGDLLNEPDLHGPAPLMFDLPTLFRDSSGRLWANTSDAIVSIDPDQALQLSAPPILSIEPLIADEKTLQGQVPHVPPGAGTIRIPYLGVSLENPEKVHYKYRLEGKRDWQDVGNRSEAVYTDLSPGKYTFAVVASNARDQWSASATVSFLVEPEYYQRFWFRATVVFLALSLCWMMYRVHLQRVAGRMRELAEERANERLRIAQDLHDTLLQGFQGLMLTFHVAALEIPVHSHVREQVEESLSKADVVMTEARDRIGRLRASDKVLTLRESLEDLGANQAKGAAHFRLHVVGTEYRLNSSFEEELLLIAREAVTNSYRHAQASQVTVTLTYGVKSFCMLCSDDGRGLPNGLRIGDTPAGHYGLLGIHERAERIGAAVKLTSSEDKGTSMSICIGARTVRLPQTFRQQLHALAEKIG